MIDITILYLRIITRAEPGLPMPFPYEWGHRRWLSTYKQFRPAIPHKVVVVNCGSHSDFDAEFDEVAHHYNYYDGLGSDCGTFQAIGRTLESDLCVACNTLAYFWRPNWLEPIAEAFQKHGKGVYGITASFEGHPHLRTPCIAFAPEVMRKYPHICDTRNKAIDFESGRANFSLWAQDSGYQSLLVTADGAVHQQHDWRKPANIFRRGDQTNCLVWDRHTLVYAEAKEPERAKLAQAADAG